jgi:hypothetical protein
MQAGIRFALPLLQVPRRLSRWCAPGGSFAQWKPSLIPRDVRRGVVLCRLPQDFRIVLTGQGPAEIREREGPFDGLEKAS